MKKAEKLRHESKNLSKDKSSVKIVRPIGNFVDNVKNRSLYPFRNENWFKILCGFANKPKGFIFMKHTLASYSGATRESIEGFIKKNESMLEFPNIPSKKLFRLKDDWWELYSDLLRIRDNDQKQQNC
jgi:hypothetical protein